MVGDRDWLRQDRKDQTDTGVEWNAVVAACLTLISSNRLI